MPTSIRARTGPSEAIPHAARMLRYRASTRRRAIHSVRQRLTSVSATAPAQSRTGRRRPRRKQRLRPQRMRPLRRRPLWLCQCVWSLWPEPMQLLHRRPVQRLNPRQRLLGYGCRRKRVVGTCSTTSRNLAPRASGNPAFLEKATSTPGRRREARHLPVPTAFFSRSSAILFLCGAFSSQGPWDRPR